MQKGWLGMKKEFSVEVTFKDGSKCIYITLIEPYYEFINGVSYLMLDDSKWKTRLRESDILNWKWYRTQ